MCAVRKQDTPPRARVHHQSLEIHPKLVMHSQLCNVAAEFLCAKHVPALVAADAELVGPSTQCVCANTVASLTLRVQLHVTGSGIG